MDGLLAARGITGLPWLVLPVEELETLQPHLKSGIDLGETVDALREPGTTFNDVLEGMVERTDLSYKDSFLYERDERLFGALGV